jgi:glyoxylase-like metal-dependent hydrolase (beta-lactamase superfamily II)
MTNATPVEPIDLRFLGVERAIGAWLVDTSHGLAVVDCGPTSTLPALEAGLAQRGARLADVQHVLLTHVHLDHAGAAGEIARRVPNALVHVSGVGAPHVTAPERLERSARRLYGDAFDQLWGALVPVPAAQVRVAGDDVCGLRCMPAVGHATHHVAYLDERDGTAYCGDAAGVRIQPHRTALPVSPPPDIDVAGWHETIARIGAWEPERLALTHFGAAVDPAAHLAQLDLRLTRWAERVRSGESQDDFTAAIEHELREAEGDGAYAAYEAAGPMFLSWLGLDRWARRSDGAPGA